jgi:predicted permease
VDIWVPIDIESPDPQFVNARNARVFDLVARLNPGTTQAQAQLDLDRVTAQMRSQFPDIYRAGQGWQVKAQPLAEKVVGNVRSALLVLLGAVGFVLLISCLNVANLTLARASAKEREVAIRTALGGTPRQLARQMLTESLMLALLGGALGLIVATVGTMALSRLTVLYLPRAREIGIDGAVLVFTGLLVLLTGLAFGLLPALGAARANLQTTLKETGRGSSASGKGLRLRAVLVVAEVAFALVLLAGAGLLIRSFTQLVAVQPGFDPGNLLTMQVWLSVQNKPEEGKYFTPVQKLAFYDRVRDQIQQVPGVRSMGFTSRLPLRGQQGISFEVEGQPVDADQPRPSAERRTVSASYFPTMGIPFVRGQNFSELADSNAPLQVVINQTLANRYWPNEDPVGRRVKLGQNFASIAGVVGDVHDVGLERPVRETMYLSYRALVPQQIAIVVRTSSRPEELSQQLVAAIRSVDPEQPVFAVSPMTQVIDDATAERRFSLLLLSFFAGVALMLAGIGIYGVISHATEQRRQEIGIRRALGADAYNVFGLILKGGLQLVAIGLVIGLAGAWLLSQVLASQLFGIGAHDPVTFLLVPVVLLGISLLALYLPARRALQVHPMTALRSE